MTNPSLLHHGIFMPLLAGTCLSLVSCNDVPNGEKKELDKEVTAFADAYFGYDFDLALQHCTPESRKWLVYAASNVHEEDLETLRSQEEGTSAEVIDYDFDSDTTGTAIVEVHRFLQTDSIGQPGRMVDQATFSLPIVHTGGKWTVRMEGLPQSEKQGHGSDED